MGGLARLLLGGLAGGGLVVFKGGDDLTHQLVPHHVRPGETDHFDVVDALQNVGAPLQARVLGRGQVDLGHVAGEHHLGPLAQSGEDHQMLGDGHVLTLVTQQEHGFQRPATHIGQGRDLDDALFHIALHRLRPQHLVQGVVQGAEIGVHLVLQVAGEETQLLPRLHRRAAHDDLVYLLVF